MPQRLRVFISSPGDVQEERLRADLVIDRLSQDYGRFFAIESYRWEHEALIASMHFQDAIEPPSAFDIVVLILWTRLGTPLPERTDVREYHGMDGRAPVTGTEWEYEEALGVARQRGAPDLLAFRNVRAAPIDPRNSDAQARSIAQLAALNTFWVRHFEDRGIFLSAYDTYSTLEDFARRLEQSLRKLIERRIREHSTQGMQSVPVWFGAPFRGLESYEFEHAAVFFGRDALVTKATEQLAANARSGHPFLLVSGASGSGKSSLVKAAIVPRLMKPQRISGIAFMRRVVFRPGTISADVVQGLAEALSHGGPNDNVGLPELIAPGQDAAQLANHFRRSPHDPGYPIANALGRVTEAGRSVGRLLAFEEAKLILIIDQLEELFTNSNVALEEHRLFSRLLSGLAQSGSVWIVATLRDDFWHRAAALPELAVLADGPGRLDVPAPSPAELTEMIRKPVQAAGLTFEIHSESGLGLDAVLAEHAAGAPGVLPLLSFALDELYNDAKTRGETVLTHASYEVLGGIKGAIAKRAEETLNALAASAQKALPRVLRALTKAASGPPVARSAPLANFAEGAPARTLIDAFVAARLLVAGNEGGTPIVRLAHEAIIGRWQRARDQLAADRRDLETRAIIEQAMTRWSQARGYTRWLLLLRNPDLANAVDLAKRWNEDLDSAICRYIRDSIHGAILVRSLAGISAVLFALVVGAVIWFRAESVQSERNAEVRLQLARAEAALRADDRDHALDDAIEARSLADTDDTRSIALMTLMEHSSPQLARRLSGPADAVHFDRADKLVSLARSGALTFQVDDSPRSVELVAAGDKYFDFAPLPDGGLFVLMSDGRVGVIDGQRMHSGLDNLEPTWLSDAGYYLGVASQSDIHVSEARVLIATVDGSLRPGRLLACDIKTLRECQQTDLPSELRAVAFSSTAQKLALATNDQVKVVDANAPNAMDAPSFNIPNGSIRSLGWTSDGENLTVGTEQGEIITVNQKKGLVTSNRLSTRPITVQKGAPSGLQIASSCDAGFLCLLTFDTSGILQNKTRFYYIPDSIVRLAWSADRRLVSLHPRGQIRLWNIESQGGILDALASPGSSLTALAVDRQSGRIAAGDAQGDILIWSGVGDTSPRRIPGNANEVVHLAFSPDGSLGAAFKDGDLARVPRDSIGNIQRVSTSCNIERVAWALSGTTLAAASPAAILLLDATGNVSRHPMDALKPGTTIGGLIGGTENLPGLIVSISDGALLSWEPGSSKPAVPLVPPKDSADTLSALSLALHPSGRWLTATRSDDEIRIYDLTGHTAPLALRLPTSDSKTVTFSPDGNLLAALMSDDQLHVWRFDASKGKAELLASVPAVPTPWQVKSDGGSPRQSQWIEWLDATHLGIATNAGMVLRLSLDPAAWTARINTLKR
jgi:WD40 repeat protein